MNRAAFDALVGVNVNALDKAANGKSDDHTELVILMIGLGTKFIILLFRIHHFK